MSWDESLVYVTLADGTVLTLTRGAAGVKAIAVVPNYGDGSVKAVADEFPIRFDIIPESAAESVAALSADCFKFKAVYTLTKAAAGEDIVLDIIEIELKDGNLVLTVDGGALADEFFSGTVCANASLIIDDGINAVTSGYFPLYLDPYNGHEYVDLGLPSGLKWATCNIGASVPEDRGDYFSWAEIETKPVYNEDTYKWGQEGQSLRYITKYTVADNQKECIWYDGGIFMGDNGDGVEHADYASYNYEDDPARQIWKGAWRTPTKEDFDELLNNTDSAWTDNYNGSGFMGYVLTSKSDATKSIFFRAAHFAFGSALYGPTTGTYWASGVNPTDCSQAWTLWFSPTVIHMSADFRMYGQPVRPVAE